MIQTNQNDMSKDKHKCKVSDINNKTTSPKHWEYNSNMWKEKYKYKKSKIKAIIQNNENRSRFAKNNNKTQFKIDRKKAKQENKTTRIT